MRRHSPARFRHGTLLGLVAACLTGWGATAQAAQWADIATISSTLGNTTGRLCVGGGATGLGCPGYAPQLGASGDVTVTGTLGATRFYGDGSGLTNLNLSGAQVDRITSGTAGIFVSNTGVISFYGASGLSGYFDATGLLVAPSVSLTGANGLSAIKGYFSGNVGVGTSNPSTQLEVMGTVSATAFVGNGAGLTNINASAITMSLDDLSDASASTALGSMYIGSGVGNNAAVTGSLGLGIEALQSNLAGGYRNSAVGYQALKSNTSGLDNTAIGAVAMVSNTTGSNNIALGVGALSQNLSGNGNVAVGRGALTRNSTAYYNVGIGYSAAAWMSTGQRNIFMGYNSGFYNTSGNNNLVLGTNAGQGSSGITTYGDSVLLGYRAGVGLTTGASNTFVGSSAGSSHVSGQYNIALGAGVQLPNTTGDYQLNLGNAIYGDLSNADTNRAKIGINVTSPNANLEVSGTVSATAFVGDGSGLTNINASAVAGLSTDRITSGTAGIFVSNTGIINLRTGGTTTGYFDASGLLVAPGISLTTGHGISSTSGYFSAPLVVGQTSSALWFASSGISTTSVYNRLLVYADAANNYSPTDNADLTIFSLNRNAGVNVAGLATSMYFWPVQSYLGKIYSSYSQTQVGSINYDTNGVAGNNSGTYNFRIHVSSTQVMQLLSTSTILSGTLRTTSWTLINANSHTRVPRAPLEVSGTVSATAFVGDGSGLTNLNLSSIQTDRITSGTAGIFVSNTGVINLRTGGTTTGYFDTSGLLVVPGVSSTGMISATSLYLQPTYTHPYYVPGTKFAAIYSGGDLNNSFILATNGSYTFFGARNNTMALSTVRDASGGSPDDIVIQHANLTSVITSLVLKGTSGWVAVGSGRWIDPSASLHVSGTTRITSWTAINANVTATAPLDVYGTVSATAFVGNGSGLTNLPAANLSETISINDLSDASSTYASGNLFMGSYAAGGVTGGTNNTAVGVLALASSTTGSYNTAVGYKAMQNYTGTALARNVAVGYRAMNQMSTGTQNVAFGFDSLFYNTAGNNNTAIGSAAMVNGLGSNNTVVGRYALYNNAYGNDNVAVGMEIGAATASSSQYISNSVLLGIRAGYNLGYAQNNVLIGYRSGYTMTNGNYNIVIGTDTTMPYNAAGSYQLNLGNALYGDLSGAAVAKARLGINVASPTLALEVSGTVSATLVQVSAKTPPSADCDDATDYGKLGLDPTTFQPRMCLPR